MSWCPLAALLLACLTLGCQRAAPEPAVELASYPISAAGDVLTRSGVEFDPGVTSDGNGALRIDARETTTVRLFETGDLDVENARLIYTAKLRSENLEGRAYLEMWAHFPSGGEFFSRALHDPLSGTIEWSSQETPFFLESGQNPDNLKLNLVVEGRGRVWIDEVRVLRAPLG